jgi:hypothetical protein
MSFAAVLLTPFVLLFPAAGVIQARELHEVPPAAVGENPPGPDATAGVGGETSRAWIFREVAGSFRIRAQNQVRVEQHMSIRVVPLSRPVTAPPPVMFNFQQRTTTTRFVERNIGRCLSISAISGVQPDMGSRLILFLRDRRMVSAVLERACRARDFYSGFYVERTADGRICVDRDTLQSRSGANCKLTRIRQLVEPDD